MIRTRFAPSPTGDLHLGHAYAARVAYDLAQKLSGEFLLRHEDIDHSRVRACFYHSIENDLRWLGLNWKGEALRQSTRSAAYQMALSQLEKLGVIYPCFCTRRQIQDEILRMAGAPQGELEQHYPGTCRELSLEESKARIENGDSYALRINMKKAKSLVGDLCFFDFKHGLHQVQADRLGDVVLSRKDIGIAYHLAVVVDDAFQNITHVTRGEDLLGATHVHRVLQSLLNFPEPVYFHHALLLDENGRRLSKRDQSMPLNQMPAMSGQDCLALIPDRPDDAIVFNNISV